MLFRSSTLADVQLAISDLLATDGLFPVLGGLASLAGLVSMPATRRMGLLLAGQMLIAYLNFRRVQAPGIHHHLLWCSGLTAATGLFATPLAARLSRPRGFGLVVAIAALGLVQSAAAIMPVAGPVRFLMWGSTAQLPLTRDDLPELEQIGRAHV